MLTGGSGSLQDAYDVGNQIVLNDGRVEIVGVTGTPDETVNDIAHLNQYGVSTTRLLSLANASKTDRRS
jgi:phage gp45-like